jgi:hypothetical protein
MYKKLPLWIVSHYHSVSIDISEHSMSHLYKNTMYKGNYTPSTISNWYLLSFSIIFFLFLAYNKKEPTVRSACLLRRL